MPFIGGENLCSGKSFGGSAVGAAIMNMFYIFKLENRILIELMIIMTRENIETKSNCITLHYHYKMGAWGNSSYLRIYSEES